MKVTFYDLCGQRALITKLAKKKFVVKCGRTYVPKKCEYK